MTAFEDRSNLEVHAAAAEASAPARVSLRPDIAARLLDLLCSDDAFRARFEANPRTALRELGHDTPIAHLGVFGLDPIINFSHIEGGLASKEVLAAGRDRLLETCGGPVFGPFTLCAS